MAVYVRVAAYIALYKVAAFLSVPPLFWVCGYPFGIIASQFLSAVGANWLALRFYGDGRGGGRLSDLGLGWNWDASWNLALGVAGGVGAATLTLLPALIAGIAHLTPSSDGPAHWGTVVFTIVVLLAGSAGEEILFHGYGFQTLLGAWGPFTTILTVAAVFGALHAANPHFTALALVNTAGFGALFGWAFLRSRGLWMPIGLHFGWNFTLPLFGVNLSGLTIRLVGHDMEWNIGSFWSGGAYGPEGGILTTAVLAVLALFIWKAPVRNSRSEALSCAR